MASKAGISRGGGPSLSLCLGALDGKGGWLLGMGLLSGMMDSVINMMGPASGTSSSPSLSASTSVGTSLEVRGIAQAKAKRALSPRSFILPNRRKKTKQGGFLHLRLPPR